MHRTRRAIAGLVALGALLVSAAPASAQSLQQQNEQILNELKAIRQLLEKLAGPIGQGQPAPAAGAADDHVKIANVVGFALGKPDAPLTMIEFTDLQCPFCRQFHVTAFEQLKKDYIDTGKLRYISRDLPLEQLHPFAMTAARAAHCAAEQGGFWEMRHAILVNNATLSNDAFDTFAKDLKMNATAFKTCMAGAAAKYDGDVKRDMADGSAAGVSGTPSFIIGRTSANGLDGVRIVGAQPYAVFDAKLKALLAAPSPTQP